MFTEQDPWRHEVTSKTSRVKSFHIMVASENLCFQLWWKISWFAACHIKGRKLRESLLQKLNEPGSLLQFTQPCWKNCCFILIVYCIFFHIFRCSEHSKKIMLWQRREVKLLLSWYLFSLSWYRVLPKIMSRFETIKQKPTSNFFVNLVPVHKNQLWRFYNDPKLKLLQNLMTVIYLHIRSKFNVFA